MFLRCMREYNHIGTKFEYLPPSAMVKTRARASYYVPQHAEYE